MKNIHYFISIIIILIPIIYFASSYENTPPPQETTGETANTFHFSKYNLTTDTSKTLIDLKLVLSGGPTKDGIPALNNPKFVSIQKANLDDDIRGIFLSLDGAERFYPYNILTWHEIVNDNIGDKHFAITFCPLCDSGIAFDREVGGEMLQFGVSGLLFESNLLMYDTKTESLWSQARGEAVVGEYLGTKLDILQIQLLTFEEVSLKYPNSSVLSEDTGYARNYKSNPYSGYRSSATIFFPVSNTDDRFPAKELFYVVPLGDIKVSFPYRQFVEGEREFSVGGKEITIQRRGGEIYVIDSTSGNSLPGYFELWFSFITHNPSNHVILDV